MNTKAGAIVNLWVCSMGLGLIIGLALIILEYRTAAIIVLSVPLTPIPLGLLAIITLEFIASVKELPKSIRILRD